MKSLIERALEHSRAEAHLRKGSFSQPQLPSGRRPFDRPASDQHDFEIGMPRILVFGVGGAGNNTINRLARIGVAGAELIAVNTDKVHLDSIKADKKILIGKTITKGLGAGGYPEIGKKAAELARPVFQELMKNADLVFIAAGMGGGTGTGAAPVIAEVAKEMGAIVVSIVTYPFRIERARMGKADMGITELRKNSDTVIVIENERLLQFVPHLPLEDAFSVADEIIAQAIKGITETITMPSLINLDYADVKAIMSGGGVAMIGVGEAEGQNRAEAVVKEVLNCPLLDIDYKGATGALIHITGGPDLTLGEANKIGMLITESLAEDANVIWGARIQEDMEGMVRVMAIITGVRSGQVLGRIDSSSELEESRKRKKYDLGSLLRVERIDSDYLVV